MPAHDPNPAILFQAFSSDSVQQATPFKDCDLYPYPNKSAALYANHFHNYGDLNSRSARAAQLQLFARPDFNAQELPTGAEMDKIDRILAGDVLGFGDGWTSRPAVVQVPRVGEPSAAVTIPGLLTRSLTKTFVHHLQTDSIVNSYHWEPQHLRHRSPSGRVQNVYSEVWHARRFRRLHIEVQRQHSHKFKDGIPCHVLALMPGSDATQLAQFGTASSWPGYMSYSNCSKYVRAMRGSSAVQHVASFPKV